MFVVMMAVGGLVGWLCPDLPSEITELHRVPGLHRPLSGARGFERQNAKVKDP